MKVTMKIKVYALLTMAVAMAGNTQVHEIQAFETFFGNEEVILMSNEGEDEGWFAEEFDSIMSNEGEDEGWFAEEFDSMARHF